MNKSDFIKQNYHTLKELYEQEEKISDAVRQLCKKKGVEYDDSFRKRAGEVLREEHSRSKRGEVSPAKIFIFDIETAPMDAEIWSIYQKRIGLNQLMSNWYMLSWAGKYLFEDHIYGDVVTPEEAIEENDERITKSLYEHINNADILIAHNGKKFDIRRVNTRLLKWGVAPPEPYQIIDTLLHMRKRFDLPSNKLDYIAKEFFDYEGKIKTNFNLWLRCKKGDSDALQEMLTYNKQDINILEEVYLRIRAWIKPHPNMGLFLADGDCGCPTCGSNDLKPAGEYNTYANTYPAHRCGNCGAVSRSRKAGTTVKKKNNILYSIPT